jgi:ATP synthase protein I
MAGDQPPKPPQSSGANDGWTMVGYLISGILVWGGIGWLADRWLHWNGIPIAVGSIIGAILGIYLVFKRYGSTST